MRTVTGEEIGKVLQELIALPEKKQPYIEIFVVDENTTYIPLKIVPSGSAVLLKGQKIKIYVSGQTGNHPYFYWNAEGQERWPSETRIISRLTVYDNFI